MTGATMTKTALTAIIGLLLLPTATCSEPALTPHERACAAAAYLAIDKGKVSQMWDDAGLVDMMCSTATLAMTNAMKGEPYAECDRLRLALAREAKARGLDLKAIGEECAKRVGP